MLTGKLRLTAIAVLASLTIGGASAAPTTASDRNGDARPGAAVPGVAPSGSDASAVYLDSAGRAMDMDVAEEAGTARQPTAIGCTPVSGRDNPHRSGTGVAASGHGWWKKGNCSNDRAKVFNCLYEWFTDNTWRQQACSETKTLKPGGGSTHRTAARRDCRGTERTSWRNHVEVDVIGEIDTGEKPMNQSEVNCRVY
ncbi:MULTISPECIES: hypothetical protein [unclassified Streptomyces]|uniref:hypothetical protein n=1 Tax=unclassified Streptomyces TaxID=2593676 RepID=UPI001F1A1933|nr:MULTISPECIES: hypothetical protein [unclassified Streptomyces]